MLKTKHKEKLGQKTKVVIFPLKGPGATPVLGGGDLPVLEFLSDSVQFYVFGNQR
jgi:hypothetical protein